MQEIGDESLSFCEVGKPPVRIAWNDIQEITVYKKDLLTEDLICFDLKVIRNEMHMTYTINEEMKGFTEIEKALQRSLPHFDKTWRNKIIKPAFESNRLCVFSREAK